MRYLIWPVLLILAGCSDSGSGITFADFVARTVSVAGPGAANCGESAAGGAQDQQNQCIGDAFTNGTNAYAIYNQQGIDSRVASALVVDETGRVFTVFFDSDSRGGGSARNGRITTDECVGPALSTNAAAQFFDLFTCTDR